MTRVHALPSEDLLEGEMVGLDVAGEPVLVLRLSDGVHAYLDRCAHQGQKLSGGTLVGTTITCPVHGWSFDARSGEGENPRGVCLRRLVAQEAGGEIRVQVAPRLRGTHE